MKATTSKIIMHIDYDSFFASVEQQANPKLRGKPIGVTGSSLTKGIVCAASREAKKFGVKTAMPLFEARKICPQIIPVKGDFTKYQYIHKHTLEIFNKYTDLVEPFSIDEAFIDVTKTLKFFGNALNLANLIKKDILESFGEYITCSIGVGPNKLMAKLVSDFNKPNGYFEINSKNLIETLDKIKLSEICGIGPRIEARLNMLGIYDMKTLRNTKYEILLAEFGPHETEFLKNASYGLHFEEVKNIEYKRPPKSIGHQHTLNKYTNNEYYLKHNLRRLSEMVARRLRNNDMSAKTLNLTLRDKDFKWYSQSATILVPTNNGTEIYKTVEKIFNDLKWKKVTRLVGVSASNLVKTKQLTYPLFPQDMDKQKRNKIADEINDKYGEYTIIPANTLIADQTKGKISSFLRHH